MIGAYDLTAPAEAVYADFSEHLDAQGIIREIARGKLATVLAVALSLPEHLHANVHVYVGEGQPSELAGVALTGLRPCYPLRELASLAAF